MPERARERTGDAGPVRTGGVEPQGLVIIAQRLLDTAQRDEGPGAVVKAARRLGRGPDTDAVGGDRLLVPAEAVRTQSLVEVRPQTLRPEPDGLPHLLGRP